MMINSLGHLLVDAPNIDMVLGRSILGRKPKSNERPRWDRLHRYCSSRMSQLKAELVLNGDRFATGESRVLAFRRKVRDMGYQVPCPCRVDTDPHVNTDPVDEYLVQYLRTLARFERPCTVALLSHDHVYADELRAIQLLGGTVWILGFPEEMPETLRELAAAGALILDLERDCGAFDVVLPRPYLRT